jgi:hypothetical protein
MAVVRQTNHQERNNDVFLGCALTECHSVRVILINHYLHTARTGRP